MARLINIPGVGINTVVLRVHRVAQWNVFMGLQNSFANAGVSKMTECHPGGDSLVVFLIIYLYIFITN